MAGQFHLDDVRSALPTPASKKGGQYSHATQGCRQTISFLPSLLYVKSGGKAKVRPVKFYFELP
jgi:hypothetical protein